MEESVAGAGQKIVNDDENGGTRWLAQVRKKLGDRRRKSPLYALQWRGTPSKNLTSAILSETGAIQIRTGAILSETGANIIALNSREDDVGVLTLSSRQGEGRNGGETVREDDVGVLTLSSRQGDGRNGGETVREDDVGVLTLSSR